MTLLQNIVILSAQDLMMYFSGIKIFDKEDQVTNYLHKRTMIYDCYFYKKLI